tara:strand:+ start:503 stop:781 length:279 start_codon:yes stop_codon:yes gene_type:complete
MKANYLVEVSITKIELPEIITSKEGYNPTLDFKMVYNITNDDIKKHQKKTNKFLNKNQWSCMNAIIQSIALENAFNDGMSPQGNLVNYKINN